MRSIGSTFRLEYLRVLLVHVSVPLREVYQGHFSSAGIKPSFRKNLNFYL